MNVTVDINLQNDKNPHPMLSDGNIHMSHGFSLPLSNLYTFFCIDNAPDYQTMSQYVEQTQKEVDELLTKLLQEETSKPELSEPHN